nr:MAG TPA: Major capsid protein [Caudoviricetes sp.]
MKNRTIEELLDDRAMIMNLQHFAEPSDQDKDDSDGDGDDDSDGDDHDDDSDGEGSKDNEKKFTQADMTATAAKEKKQGRAAAFREMGFKSEKEAKAQLEAFRKYQESQLTPEQKTAAQIQQANDDKSDAEKRAEAAENKLAAIQAGVKKDAVDDAVAIAMMKVEDGKSLEDVLAEMKAQPRYKGFFDGSEEEEDDKGGTGTSVRHKTSKKDEGIGKRLGQAQVQSQSKGATKSSFFRN